MSDIDDIYDTPEAAKVSGIYPPEGGWKRLTHYIVEVAFNEFNPIHRSILYTGFIEDDGTPGNYNGIFSQGEAHSTFKDVYYIRAIAELVIPKEKTKNPSIELITDASV